MRKFKPVLTGLFLAWSLCLGLPLLAQSDQVSGNYIMFKVSDPTYTENFAKLQSFLIETYDVSGSIETLSVERPTYAVHLVDGVRLHKLLGVEAAFSYFGNSTVSATTSDGGQVTLKRKSYGGSIVGLAYLPFKSKFSAYAKVGAGYWRVDSSLEGASTATSPAKSHKDGISAIYGAGIRMTFAKQAHFGLSWETTEIDEADIDTLTAAAGFRF